MVERHAAFHAERQKQLEQQLTPITFKLAMEQRLSEAKRGIPINYWSFEGGVEDAARASAIVIGELARKGGRSKKTDALQELIIDIVRDKREITVPRLLARLLELTGAGIIDDVDTEGDPIPMIYFRGHNGRNGMAPISGRKDRLSRAKKFVREELALTR
jgi:hypothetical protein